MQDQMNKQNRDKHAVSLMTLHAAKGLEFDLVILPGVEESIIPTTRSLMSNNALEEERRLFYVGITRAREHLMISYAKHRYSYGQMVDQLPSRFLREIPSNLLPLEDCSYWNTTQSNQFFSDWLGVQGKTTDIYIPTTRSNPSIHFEDETLRTSGRKNTALNPARPECPARGVSKGATNSSWKKNQPVKHAKYGIGTIQDIEEKTNGDIHLSIQFKIGLKKIVAQFVQKI
jgi:DNA helicase-2/ATP-dependent DNA helicase PcrA